MKKFDPARAKTRTFVPLVNKSYAHYNPHLTLSGFHYLGLEIEPSLQENKSRPKIVCNLKEWLETVMDRFATRTVLKRAASFETGCQF